MRKKIAQITLLTCAAFAHHTALSSPKNMSVVFGGNDNGNPIAENMFVDKIGNLASELSTHGWDTYLAFDSDTSGFARKYSDDPSNTPLPKTLYPGTSRLRQAKKQDLYDLLDKANENLSAGDQFLLNIDTHGGYGLMVGADQNIKYDDPEILKRLKALKEKGVKIGIVFNACFSGSALKLWSQFGCVLSSGPQNVVTSGQYMTSEMTKAAAMSPKHPYSLEDVYLEQISDRSNPNLNQISSFPEGEDFSTYAIELERYRVLFKDHPEYYSKVKECTPKTDEILGQIKSLSDPANLYQNQEKLKELFGKKKDFEGLAKSLEEKTKKLAELNEKIDATFLKEQTAMKECYSRGKGNFKTKLEFDYSKMKNSVDDTRTKLSNFFRGSKVTVKSTETGASVFVVDSDPCRFALQQGKISNEFQGSELQILNQGFTEAESRMTPDEIEVMTKTRDTLRGLPNIAPLIEQSDKMASEDISSLQKPLLAEMYLNKIKDHPNTDCSNFVVNPKKK